ncbi:MAG: PrsW family intramembrane metalloprotease [Lachnospiraceae bacterium]|nr:PrsW family intramembrane metalloprotease [Lachnospiraceae bacterium]
MIYAENILVCIAIPLIVSLLFIRGEVRRYLSAFLLGMAMCLLSAYIDGYLDLVTGMGGNETSIYLSPVVEELMKLMPLLLYILLLEPGERMLTMLAVAIGAGFATYENCCYILTSGAEDLGYILIRGLAVGVMHIVSILALSIWFVIARRLKVFSFVSVAVGVSIAMIFHALYNLLVSEPGISTMIGFAMPVMTAFLLFLLYRRLTSVSDDTFGS